MEYSNALPESEVQSSPVRLRLHRDLLLSQKSSRIPVRNEPDTLEVLFLNELQKPFFAVVRKSEWG